MTNLPIFPLPVYLLPEGITRLRIFEPRYLKMIKIASKDQGFVILSTNKDNSSKAIGWGSWVEIINFDQAKDGLLEIDVKCRSLVNLLSMAPDKDNLNFGDIIPITHWSQNKSEVSTTDLSDTLTEIINTSPLLKTLYYDKSIDNLNWVVARWLELLPISSDIKNTFIVNNNFEVAKSFVQSIVVKPST